MGLFLFLMGILFIPVACDSGSSGGFHERTEHTDFKPVVVPGTARAVWVFELDGCEYLMSGGYIIHKANCSNPEHESR